MNKIHMFTRIQNKIKNAMHTMNNDEIVIEANLKQHKYHQTESLDQGSIQQKFEFIVSESRVSFGESGVCKAPFL